MVILGAQNRPQEGRRGEETRLRRRYEPKKVSRELQEEPKMVSWLPRSSQETPKSIPEEPKNFPRSPQEHPKGAQETPKTLSEPWSDQKRRFFRIRRMSWLKSMILRLGWSSWGLKIDPKRVEEENEHVLEEDMRQRECQESSKRSPRWSLGSREAPKSPPRASKRILSDSQEALKSTQKEPKRTPSFHQEHTSIPKLDVSKTELPPSQNQGF